MGSASGFGGIDEGLNALGQSELFLRYYGFSSNGGVFFWKRRAERENGAEEQSDVAAHVSDYTRIMKQAVGLFFLLTAVWADDVAVRPKISDYPQMMKLGKADVGAEFHAHTLPLGEGAGKAPLFAGDYLVVEIAIYPAPFVRMQVNPSDFTLRLNGKKVVESQSSGMVVRRMKNTRSNLPALVIGSGPGEVVVGGSQRQPRFPGDQTGSRQPRPSPVPEEEHPGVEKAPESKPEELVPERELRNEIVDKPVAGYLFFPYEGKLKALKSIELIYDGPAGKGRVGLQ